MPLTGSKDARRRSAWREVSCRDVACNVSTMHPAMLFSAKPSPNSPNAIPGIINPMRAFRSCLRLVPYLICLLAFAVRVWHLSFPAFNGDEGFTYMLASLSYGDLARKIIEIGEPQPVGSFFLEKLWLDMGGDSEFNLRLLNVCFGVLAVAMMWRLMRFGVTRMGRGQARPLPAIAAMLILAFNPFGLEHSREYRTYAMALALSLACVLALLAYARRPHLPQAVLVVGCGWAAIQAHYVAGFVLAALNVAVFVWHGLTQRDPAIDRPPALLRWLLLQALVLALTLPWLILVRGTTNTYPGTGRGQLSLATVFFEEMALFTVGDVNHEWAWPAIIIGTLALLLGLALLWIHHGRARLFAVLMLSTVALPLLTVWGLTWVKPIFHPRYLIVIWPMAIALMCAPLSMLRLAERPLRLRSAGILSVPALALIGLTIFSGWQYHRNLSYQNHWQALVDDVLACTVDLPPTYIRIGINMPDPAFLYYYHKTVPGRENSLTFPLDRDSPKRSIEALDTFAQQRVRRVLVHVVPNGWWDVNHLAASLDPRSYTKVGTLQRRDDHFDIYERTFVDQLSPINTEFQNGMQVLGAEVLTDSFQTALAVEIKFVAPSSGLITPTKTFLHLIDPAAPDNVVTQLDQPLPTDLSQPHLYGIPLPHGLLKREYELWLGLYEPQSPGAPRVLTRAGQDRILLGRFVLGAHNP